MPRLLAAGALALALAGSRTPVVSPEPAAGEPALVVQSAPQLVAALQPGNAGRRIRILRGDYDVDRPLVVPDGATLEGEGVMVIGPDGLPGGFEPGTATTLRAAGAFDGHLLALGHGSAVRGLRLLDLGSASSQPASRQGNVVYLASHVPGDVIAASVGDCEIVTDQTLGFSDVGPHGHGVVALTLNPNLGAPPAAHEGARIELTVRRSIVRTRSGAAMFANNFAPGGAIRLLLEGNRFEGYLIASGGTTRPEQVHDARVVVESHGNLYRRTAFDRFGWHLLGASTSPHVQEAPGQGGARNSLRMTSRDDRIEGFRVGIQAAAARRLGLGSEPLSDNQLELDLRGTRIATEGDGAADLVLRATVSEIEQERAPMELPAGDRNVLRVRMSGVTGSGQRRNVFAEVAGPRNPANFGIGNQLRVVGELETFRQSNRAIRPLPGPQYFSAGH
jgi:hypothetical protein